MSARPKTSGPDQYGVVGHPVAHSLSPFIHGMFARECAQNLVYRLHDIEPPNFRSVTLQLFTNGVRGLNVTLPHKEAAAELVNELTPRAAHAQAVNTITLREDNSLIGDNTDGIGLKRDLQVNLGLDLRGRRVLMLGAGGAARGVIAPLLEWGVESLVVANRTIARASALAERFADFGPIRACQFETIEGPAYDLILNATSAGLTGQMPALPPGLVNEDTVCYDMAYGRGHTPFTLWAKSLHASRISKGWGMLVEQAAESFFVWRGVLPKTLPVLEALLHRS